MFSRLSFLSGNFFSNEGGVHPLGYLFKPCFQRIHRVGYVLKLWLSIFSLAFLSHVYGKFMEIISLKAPGNYFASIWINNFSICLWENPKTLMSMISGFPDVSPSPKTNYVYLWRHKDTKKTFKSAPGTFFI